MDSQEGYGVVLFKYIAFNFVNTSEPSELLLTSSTGGGLRTGFRVGGTRKTCWSLDEICHTSFCGTSFQFFLQYLLLGGILGSLSYYLLLCNCVTANKFDFQLRKE